MRFIFKTIGVTIFCTTFFVVNSDFVSAQRQQHAASLNLRQSQRASTGAVSNNELVAIPNIQEGAVASTPPPSTPPPSTQRPSTQPRSTPLGSTRLNSTSTQTATVALPRDVLQNATLQNATLQNATLRNPVRLNRHRAKMGANHNGIWLSRGRQKSKNSRVLKNNSTWPKWPKDRCLRPWVVCVLSSACFSLSCGCLKNRIQNWLMVFPRRPLRSWEPLLSTASRRCNWCD